MSELLESNLSFLRMLEQANVKQRKALLLHASREQFRTLITMIYNILRGNIPVSVADKIRLRRYKSCIRKLANRTVSNHDKLEQLIKHHSILPICIKQLLDYFDFENIQHEQAYGSSHKRQLPAVDNQPRRREESESDTSVTESEDDTEEYE